MSALIAYRNLADAATFTAGAALSGYPLANMQTRQLAQVARLNSGFGGGTFALDLGSLQTVRLVALLGINPTGIPPAPPTYWMDVLVEYSANGTDFSTAWSQAPLDTGAPDLPYNIIVPVGESSTQRSFQARYLRISPGWNTPAGVTYFEIGRLWIGDTIEIPNGCDGGWSLAGRDPGGLDESAGLQIYADRRARGRVLSMPVSGVSTDIAFGFDDEDSSATYQPSLDDLVNYAGATGEVIAIPRANSPIWTRRTGIYGHLTPDSLRIRHMSGPKYAMDLTVIEER